MGTGSYNQQKNEQKRFDLYRHRTPPVWCIYLILTILCTCAACQNPPPQTDQLPTPTVSSRPALNIAPTFTLRAIDAPTTDPCADGRCVSPTAEPSVTATLLPLENPIPADSGTIVIGTSVAGRSLTAQRLGSGERVLLLVGGMHGGWEENTVTLMNELIAYFSAAPAELPAGITLVIVPVANPDGLEYGRSERGRFNDNGVDLNRNWSCEWSREAFWRQERVNPGLRAFSEPETLALANYILQIRPLAVLFYHSAANGVYAGNCDSDHGSAALAAVLGDATGYSYGSPFTAYPVTGTAATWADGQGIPAADVELETSSDSEFERNLRGILAVMEWLE